MKAIVLLLTLSAFLFGDNLSYLKSLQSSEIEVTHTYNGKSQDIIIQREINPICKKYHVTPETVHGEIFNKMEQLCKRTIVTSIGKVQPFDIFGLKTIGELEVLDHIIKANEEPEKYVLVDVRKEEWYEIVTIPSAVNIPYPNIAYDEDFPEDHQKLLTTFNSKFPMPEAIVLRIFLLGLLNNTTRQIPTIKNHTPKSGKISPNTNFLAKKNAPQSILAQPMSERHLTEGAFSIERHR